MAYFSSRSALGVRTFENDRKNVNVAQITGDINDAHRGVEAAEKRLAEALRRKEIQLTEQLQIAESQIEQVKVQKDTEYQLRMKEKNDEIERLQAELASRDTDEETKKGSHGMAMSELDRQIEALKQSVADEKAQRMTSEIDLDSRRASIRKLTESISSVEKQYHHDQRLLRLFRDAHNELDVDVQNFHSSSSAHRPISAIQRGGTTTTITSVESAVISLGPL